MCSCRPEEDKLAEVPFHQHQCPENGLFLHIWRSPSTLVAPCNARPLSRHRWRHSCSSSYSWHTGAQSTGSSVNQARIICGLFEQIISNNPRITTALFAIICGSFMDYLRIFVVLFVGLFVVLFEIFCQIICQIIWLYWRTIFWLFAGYFSWLEDYLSVIWDYLLVIWEIISGIFEIIGGLFVNYLSMFEIICGLFERLFLGNLRLFADCM